MHEFFAWFHASNWSRQLYDDGFSWKRPSLWFNARLIIFRNGIVKTDYGCKCNWIVNSPPPVPLCVISLNILLSSATVFCIVYSSLPKLPLLPLPLLLFFRFNISRWLSQSSFLVSHVSPCVSILSLPVSLPLITPLIPPSTIYSDKIFIPQLSISTPSSYFSPQRSLIYPQNIYHSLFTFSHLPPRYYPPLFLFL